MKKIKLFLCVALFGAMSFGAFTAYDYVTMSADEKALLENVEALTSFETDNQMGALYVGIINPDTLETYNCCRLDTPEKICRALACPPGTQFGN